MANADFSPRQGESETPRGFERGSYRAPAAPQQAERRLTPVQQKLAGLEKALPAPLRSRIIAAALAAVVMAGSFAGIGSAKLRAGYEEARGWYTAGVAADNGYTLHDELITRADCAANVITTATHTEGIGADSPYVAEAQRAQQALEQELNRSEPDMNALYRANAALGAAVDQLYSAMQAQAEDPFRMGAVQGQYSAFHSADTVIGSLSYNSAAAAYNREVGGFPASLLRGLTGIPEVKLFA